MQRTNEEAQGLAQNQTNNQQNVEAKKLFHPFAEKPSPVEEWKQVIILAFETMIQFFLWDVFGNLFKYSGKALGYIFFLTPILLIAMLGESMRRLKNKVRIYIKLLFLSK